MAIDLSALKAPPSAAPVKRGPGRPRKVADSTPKPSRFEERANGLMGLGQLLQGGLMLGKQYADAAAIGMHWQPVATEVARLAETLEPVAKTVDMLIQAGPYAALIQAVMPLAMQLAANHGYVPATMTGIVPPEVLRTQMEAQMLQTQADAYRAQQEAMRAAEAAKNDLEALIASQQAPSPNGVNGAHV